MNKQIFELVKIKPFLQVLSMSPSRFTQKLHQYKIKGLEQSFTTDEKSKIKQSLLVIADLIEQEAKNIK